MGAQQLKQISSKNLGLRVSSKVSEREREREREREVKDVTGQR